MPGSKQATPAMVRLMAEIQTVRTADLSGRGLQEITQLMEAAFGESFDGYWDDIGPALHFMALEIGEVLAHACIVDRELHTQGHQLKTGYVEGVAARPDRQGQGHSTMVMQAVNEFLVEHYELGGLSTGVNGFYTKLGWETWEGRTYIRMSDGTLARTAEEDGTVMILRTNTTPALSTRASLSAEWRPGEVW